MGVLELAFMVKRWIIARKARNTAALLIVIAVFVSGFTLGSLHSASPASAQTETVPTLVPEPPDGTQTLFKPFWEAWTLLHQNYVDPLDDNMLMEGALSGMMSSLGDRHTNYFDPATAKSVDEEMDGHYSGIGATLKKDDKSGRTVIVSTMVDAPARKAGILPGDVIMQIDGMDISMLSETMVISKVRGPSGTIVRLGILRNDQKPLLQIPIQRAQITIMTVTTSLFAGDIGYISLREFNNLAGREFTRGLQKLGANKLKGLVLDLRGNPGGYLTTAVEIASQFLRKGNVTLERGKDGSSQSYPVNGRPLAPNVPLIVLVDGGSASASELLAGALQDYGRARLLGERTYGKGSVQIIEPLSNGGAAHITIARWYTPKGRTIQDIGLEPDIPFTWDQESQPDRDIQLEQAVLILRGEL
jgi:carboxyl-terminal processing protease